MVRRTSLILIACLWLASCQTTAQRIAMDAAIKAAAQVPRPILTLPSDCIAHIFPPPAPTIADLGQLSRDREELWLGKARSRNRKADNCAAFEAQWNRERGAK